MIEPVASYLLEEKQRAAAVDYMMQQLGGGKALAKLLLETVDFGRGTVTILSVVQLSETQMREFNWGHVPPREDQAQIITIAGQPVLAYPKTGSHEDLVELIFNSLRNPGDLCMLEHFLASPSDGWLKRTKSRVGIHGADVYLILALADRAKDIIEDARKHAECLPVFVGAIGRQPPDRIADDLEHVTISLGQLKSFAKSAYCIFVGAYDGEGYLVWKDG